MRVVPNRYPAFEGDEPLRVHNLGPVFTQAAASGIHEVLVFSPDHDGSWADLDDAQAAVTMAAIRDRMEDHARRPQIRYTQVIVNHGREAGASLEHPHGQLLGIPFVPGEIAEEEAGFRRFEGSCLLCTTLEAEEAAGHRVVYADERVVVVCPFWSGTPVRDAGAAPDPRGPRHRRRAARRGRRRAGDARRAGPAAGHASGDVAYNLVFHTAPHRHAGPYHWHVHVLPRLTSVAGFEQGTGRADRHRRPPSWPPSSSRVVGCTAVVASSQLGGAALLGAALDAELVALGVGERRPPGAVGPAVVARPSVAPSASSRSTSSSRGWSGCRSRWTRFLPGFGSGTTWNSRFGRPSPSTTMASGSPGWSSSCSGRSNTCDQKLARA